MSPSPLLALAPVPDDLRVWARAQRTLVGAWATCERADWLVAMGLAAGVERRLTVSVACDCVERVCRGRGLPDAWTLARRWTRGEVEGREAWAAGFRAAARARDAQTELEARVQRAAASVAFACDEEADAGYYAERRHAAEAIRHAVQIAPGRQVELAAHVRRRIDVDRVEAGLVALARAGSVPPPPVDGHGEDGPLAPVVTERLLRRLRARR